MIQTIINTVVVLDKQLPPVLRFGQYGKFSILHQHEASLKVTTFDLKKDVRFEHYSERKLISAEEKLKRIEKEGDVPLDIRCAFAIWKNKVLLRYLIDMWSDYARFPYKRKALDFPGALLIDNCNPPRKHILSIDRGNDNTCTLLPYEIYDQGWDENSPSLIFNLKSENIKRQLC